MAKIILTLNNVLLSEHSLVKVRTNIGRRPTNEIHLDNLAISGEHSAIVKMGSDYFVEDLDSTNGTLVNGEVTKKHLLQHGDIIELGKYQLKYVNDAADTPTMNASSAFEKTMMMHPSKIKSARSKSTEAPIVSSPPKMPIEVPKASSDISDYPQAMISGMHVSQASVKVGKIQVLNGSGSGRELVLNKSLTTLGRTGVQVAVITRRPHGYFITHVEGKVLPVVNGISTGLQAFALTDHDVIELAGVKMEFYLTNP
jgi:pSer/pThr/pTyr-binding forkhead associated (FHA) protein